MKAVAESTTERCFLAWPAMVPGMGDRPACFLLPPGESFIHRPGRRCRSGRLGYGLLGYGQEYSNIVVSRVIFDVTDIIRIMGITNIAISSRNAWRIPSRAAAMLTAPPRTRPRLPFEVVDKDTMSL